MPMDKGMGAIMYQAGKEPTSQIRGPRGDKSVDFKNDSYDASERFADKKGGYVGKYGAWVDWHYL